MNRLIFVIIFLISFQTFAQLKSTWYISSNSPPVKHLYLKLNDSDGNSYIYLVDVDIEENTVFKIFEEPGVWKWGQIEMDWNDWKIPNTAFTACYTYLMEAGYVYYAVRVGYEDEVEIWRSFWWEDMEGKYGKEGAIIIGDQEFVRSLTIEKNFRNFYIN